MKRFYVAAWSLTGWACLLGMKNWWLALAAWTVAALITVCKK